MPLLVEGWQGHPSQPALHRLAQASLCRTAEAADRPCGRCRDCRWWQAGTHPDVRWLAPVGQTIGIDAVRDALAWGASPPQAGPYRVLVIDQADRLGREAAVALLKSLEDPPGPWRCFLGSDRPGLLPDALRSRCVAVRAGAHTPPTEAVPVRPEGPASWLELAERARVDAEDPPAAVRAARRRLAEDLRSGRLSPAGVRRRWRALMAAEAALSRGAQGRLVVEALWRAEVEDDDAT